MVQMSSNQGVLFLRNENEEYKWFQDGDEDKDGKYVGEIEYGEPNTVKEPTLYLTDTSMQENGRMGMNMGKGPSLYLMG